MSDAMPSKPLDACQISFRASQLVNGDRAQQHGDKLQNHQNIATLWNAYLKIRRDPTSPLDAHDAAIFQALLKIARTQSGNHNVDDYVDGAGYLALAGEIAERSK